MFPAKQPGDPMPRKSRKKAQAESPATEPTSVAAVLDQSPIGQILASHEAKAQVEPERPLPEPPAVEPERATVESEQRVPTSFADAVKASRAAFAPIAEGFVNVDSFPAAGLKVNRSRD